METDQFTFVKNRFHEIFRAVEHLSEDEILNAADDRFRPCLDRLNQMAALDVEETLVQALLNDADFKAMIGPIARIKRLHSIRLETDRAQHIIRSADPWRTLTDFVYYPNYLKLAEMEYIGAGLNPKDQVLFIGSGPLPLSLILLCKQYDIYGVGLEQHHEYMRLSRDLVEALGLSRRIRIIEGNHFSLPLDTQCRLIMVGAEALPKEEIFNHLAKVLPLKTKLSYRIFEKGLRRLLDDQPDVSPPPVFREFARVRPEPPVNNTAVFLIKEKQS